MQSHCTGGTAWTVHTVAIVSSTWTPGGLLAKALRPFTRVKPGEAATVLLMGLSAFLLMSAYYLLKTVREPLILLQGGAEVKLYARASQAIVMVGFVYVYGELARRVGRRKLLVIVFLFFLTNLAAFAILARTHLAIGLPFFLWLGVFSYTIVAQFWGLAADIYDEEQGKRLFPIIGAGSSIGAIVGSRFAKALMPLGAPTLMGTALVILIACVAVIVLVERRVAPAAVPTDKKTPEAPLSTEGVFHLLARDRFLLVIAGMVVLLNWVNSSGEYLLDRTLVVAANDAAAHGASAETYIGTFKADYYAWYNAIGVVLELFVVSRVLRVVGTRKALYVMPVFALMAYSTAAVFPVLAVMRLVKIGENGLQYSLQDTTRHALFLVTSRAEKFIGKTAVDTIAVRIGSVFSALVVFVGTRYGWSTARFATLDAVLVVGWLAFVVAIGREHLRRSNQGAELIATEPHLPAAPATT
jgi:AAA family ATP:ADP antiporter